MKQRAALGPEQQDELTEISSDPLGPGAELQGWMGSSLLPEDSDWPVFHVSFQTDSQRKPSVSRKAWGKASPFGGFWVVFSF